MCDTVTVTRVWSVFNPRCGEGVVGAWLCMALFYSVLVVNTLIAKVGARAVPPCAFLPRERKKAGVHLVSVGEAY